ncbi:hypothetical protein BGZ63DRAFT_346906 [Mariannaea sp. PMI_226]|nr:hypothetical protein BGZ63DRAFT_346906 [Mariannaea sp. PMI_226]
MATTETLPVHDSHRANVAIIGTGLAGLTTAYLLHNDDKKQYAVTLFEQVRYVGVTRTDPSLAQADSLSFDSASIAVKNDKTNVAERIDLPMRALAGGYYANVLRMYHYLRIPLHPVRFLFVFAKAFSISDTSTNKTDSANSGRGYVGATSGTYFVHASNMHQMLPPWPGTRSILSHIAEVVYLIVCYFWFSMACFMITPSSKGKSSESFAEYLERIQIPRRYVSHYLLPLMSSVSTCSHDELLAFPASDVVNYKKLSTWQQHYTVCGGVRQVQGKLVEGLQDIRLNARVVEVVAPKANQSGVAIRWQSKGEASSQVVEQTFDRVILAVSPDVAGSIFDPLRSALRRIPTVRVESSVLCPETDKGERETLKLENVETVERLACSHHLEESFPPQVITLRTRFSEATGSRTEALHTMPTGVVVSTCPLDGAAEMKRSLQTAWFTRTLRTAESRAVVEEIMGTSAELTTEAGRAGWVNGEDNVWLAGAWCWDGMVLLEGCVVVKSDFAVGFVGGIVFVLALAAILSVTLIRTTDRYGLDHWKLNLDTPLKSMWMNVGYWRNAQGEPILRFEEACAALLQQILNSSGLLDKDAAKNPKGSALAILDLGFGCGDQTWELTRLCKRAGWTDFQYVGLTLNEAQVQSAQRRIYREVADGNIEGLKAESFTIFRANAAKPETWNNRVAEVVNSLKDEKFAETWLLALDCLYHFSPSRRPIFKYASSQLDAHVMVFDLFLNENASTWETIKIRAIGVMMGCPVRAFLTEEQYINELVECGYEKESIVIRDVSEHVFPGLVEFLDRQERALAEYGISLGGFKLAQRLFNWFAKSKVVKPVIVVARTKGK